MTSEERAAACAAIDADFDPTIPGECFDKQGIARLFGVPVYQITEAIKRGAPVQVRGNQRTPWQINAGDFLCWQIKDACGLLEDSTAASEYHSAKTRKMRADAGRIEHHNAKLRAVTLTVDEVTELYREEADLIRRELRAFPKAALAALAKLPPDERRNASIVENVLDDCVNNALKAISSSGVENASA